MAKVYWIQAWYVNLEFHEGEIEDNYTEKTFKFKGENVRRHFVARYQHYHFDAMSAMEQYKRKLTGKVLVIKKGLEEAENLLKELEDKITTGDIEWIGR